MTVLSWAARNNDKTIVEVLLKNGAQANIVAKFRRINIQIGAFIAQGEFAHITVQGAMTALSWAAKNGDKTMVVLLLRNGADINTTAQLKLTNLKIDTFIAKGKFAHLTV